MVPSNAKSIFLDSGSSQVTPHSPTHGQVTDLSNFFLPTVHNEYILPWPRPVATCLSSCEMLLKAFWMSHFTITNSGFASISILILWTNFAAPLSLNTICWGSKYDRSAGLLDLMTSFLSLQAWHYSYRPDQPCSQWTHPTSTLSLSETHLCPTEFVCCQ